MRFSEIPLQYCINFGEDNYSETFEFEVALNEAQQRAYKKAVMTGKLLETVEELNGLCEKMYPEVIEYELGDFSQLFDTYGERYDEEFLKASLEVYFPFVDGSEVENEEIEEYIRECHAAGDIETIASIVQIQKRVYWSNEFDSIESFVASLQK